VAVADPGPAYRRDAATWVCFAALFAFGALNAVLGPALPYLRHSEHISYLTGALHQVAFAIGGTAAGMQASRSHAPRRRTIAVGLAGAGLASLLLGYGHVFALTALAALLISALATAALIRLWAVLADAHRAQRAVAMTEGEIAVSLAGMGIPLVVSLCAATVVGWRFAFVITCAVALAAVAAVRTVRLPEATPAPVPMAGASASPYRGGRTLATIFAVVGLEFTVSFWAASYLHDDVGAAQDTAAALVSVLYAANLAGRLVASRLARRWPAGTVLRLSLGTALVGTPVLLAAHSLPLAAVGLVLAGTGIGGTFPLASSLHVAASGRTADQALGQILTVAGIGQIAGPLACGALAQSADLRVGLLVAPALVLVAAATTAGVTRPA
jgi:MFS family permease